jgi:hypothetical protein
MLKINKLPCSTILCGALKFLFKVIKALLAKKLHPQQ